MSGRQRLVNLAIAAAIAVAAVVIILATSGGDDEPEREAAATPAPTQSQTEVSPGARKTPAPKPTPEPTPEITVRGGEVQGGIADLRVDQGDRVRFAVTADVADHVHVHAYDFMKDVEPGKPVRFDFPADITGIIEIELEDAGLEIAELRVSP